MLSQAQEPSAIIVLFRKPHGLPTPSPLTKAALSAGLDVELPTAQCFPAGIPEALERGILDEATVDLAVERVLTLKIRLGLFERPYADADAVVLDLPEERALSREVAVRSITLLSNDGVLPLSRDTARIAVKTSNG